jgi:hypothetical protein
MIVVENPVQMVRENAEHIAQMVLKTDMTNITMSQWQVESHEEKGDVSYIAYCAINRRLDPLEKPFMLHMRAQDFDHLKLMFHFVEFMA